MHKFSVSLEICTLYNGLPHGIAIIQCTNIESDGLSFRGVGVFDNGKLHNAPFTCVDGNGNSRSYSKMKDGRPADGSYRTEFNREGSTAHVRSFEGISDTSGWQQYSGQADKEGKRNGQAKYWEDKGIYIGTYKNNSRSEGKYYELQKDRTYTLFNLKFDEKG